MVGGQDPHPACPEPPAHSNAPSSTEVEEGGFGIAYFPYFTARVLRPTSMVPVAMRKIAKAVSPLVLLDAPV